MKNNRGFTLVEVMIGLVIGTILLLGMGAVMIQLFVGMRESRNFSEATARVDLIRTLNFDARTSDVLFFPATDGATGAYTEGGMNGHQVIFRTVNFDPGTGNTTREWVRWRSERAGNAGPYTVRRVTQASTGGTPGTTWGTPRFTQPGIETFNVQRITRNNFTLEMNTQEGEESAHVLFSVTLRNAQ